MMSKTELPELSPSFRASGRIGEQEPRFRIENGIAAYTDGEDAAMLMRMSGVELFPWQRTVLDAWLACDESDRPSYTTCGLSVPRQNGKNLDLEGYEAYKLAVCGAHILHTAHRVRTAKESFTRLVNHFSDRVNPELAALVSKIRYTNGEESILLKNGGRIEFSARGRASIRGFADVQCVIFDEAQDLTDDQLSAVMYTLAASSTGDRQMIFTGTPPDPRSPGTVFARRRLSAIADTPSARTCWHEWSVDELPEMGCTYADIVDSVYATNPSMGLTLDNEWTEDEFNNASLDGFARERLGWWSSTDTHIDSVISRADWDACRTTHPRKDGLVTYAVRFSPDGKRGSMAACHKPEDGAAPFVYVVANRSTDGGIGWFVSTLTQHADKAAQIVIDGRSHAQTLHDRLLRAGVRKRVLMPDKTTNMTDACAAFLDAVQEHSIRHYGQEALDMSATMTTRREIGSAGGWGFESNADADATMVEACALAYWSAMNTKRKPGRRAVVRV